MIESLNNKGVPGVGVLEPVSEEEFFTNYWETQPLHIARSSSNPFEQLISISAIEDLLSTNELFYPTVQLSHAGKRILPAEYSDEQNKIISGRVVERYRLGSTIVLTHMHKLHKELMGLCRDMHRRFMMRCQTNVYLSPAGNQGFNPHFDTHDVFILQVSGNKTFNFYSGGCQLPTSADSFNKDVHEIGSQTESIALSAGDTLYIPRGFTHDAVASGEDPSLHITLGVYPILMHELLQELLQVSISSNASLRKSVPQALWMLQDSAAPTATQLSEIVQHLTNNSSLDQALSQLRDEVALDVTKDCFNAIRSTKDQPLQSHSVVRVIHESILQLERSGECLKLRTFGAIVEFSEPYSAAVEWLVEQSQCSVEAIPGIDSSQRTALLEKLRENDVVTLT